MWHHAAAAPLAQPCFFRPLHYCPPVPPPLPTVRPLYLLSSLPPFFVASFGNAQLTKLPSAQLSLLASVRPLAYSAFFVSCFICFSLPRQSCLFLLACPSPPSDLPPPLSFWINCQPPFYTAVTSTAVTSTVATSSVLHPSTRQPTSSYPPPRPIRLLCALDGWLPVDKALLRRQYSPQWRHSHRWCPAGSLEPPAPGHPSGHPTQGTNSGPLNAPPETTYHC